jgi:hypothetical protein
MKLHECLLREVCKGCKFYANEEGIYCQYFPLVDGAYIEHEGEGYWYECDSIAEAVSKHLDALKYETKRVG